MIKYNNKTINDWYFDNKNVIKVYKNNAVCYYKIVSGGGTPSQEPCFAVVDDITQYSDTEFIDVYDKATEKWYKLNNLDQYEEYGVYGSGRTVCEGSTSRLPQGYTEVEYVGSNGNAYINTGLQLMNTVGNTFSIEGRVWTEYYVTNDGFGYLMSTESTTSPYPGFCWRWNQNHSSVLELSDVGSNAILSTVDKGDGTSGFTVSSNGISKTNNNIPFSLFAGLTGTSSSNSAWRFSKSKYYDELKITKNNQVVADYIPCQRDSDSKYGFYDLISESFITSSNSYALIGGNPITPADCVTVYEGKLTIDNGYEYEWDGSEWVSLGEVTGSSIIIHSPEYLERTSSSSGYLPLGETFQLNTTIEMDFQMTQAKGNAIIGDYGTNDSNDWRLFLNYDTRVNNLLSYDFINTRAQYNTGNWAKRFNIRIGNYYVVDIDTGTRLINSTRKTSFTRPNQMYLFHMEGSQITNNTDYGHIYSVKIYQDGTLVKDYIPWTDGNGTYGMWDKVSNQSVTSVGQMTGSSVVHDIDVGDEPEYPKYYTEKDEPENNVVFTDMAEALAYQCPWVGMDATIDNTPYLFGDAYEWLTKYGLFEVSGEYMCYNGNKYEKMEEMVRNTDGTWSSQIPAVYEKGDLIEAGSTDCGLPKYTATYTDGTVVTASCGDSGDVLVINEISKTNLKTVVLGECVTRISGECFSDCSKLESVTIEGNTTIDAYSFARNNSKLKTIRMQATTPPQCNSKAFTYYKSGSGYIPMESIRIYVPSASLNAYKAASGWKTYSSKIYGY